MSKPNDGGEAFPFVVPIQFDNVYEGMTLRDWFAGQAVAAVYHDWNDWGTQGLPRNAGTDIAFYAYKIADAMIMERTREDTDEQV